MRLKELRFVGFRRFTDLTITDLPDTARLIVLAGPNGTGKSSIFDGLRTWQFTLGFNYGWDETYGHKKGSPKVDWTQHVRVAFHGDQYPKHGDVAGLIYLRSAFRHDPDFSLANVSVMPDPTQNQRTMKTIDHDASVSENYQRLIMQSLEMVFEENPETEQMPRKELRDAILGEVRRSMSNVFDDLTVEEVSGIGKPSSPATFLFSKGQSKRFLYKNLSAGEKALFDLILDIVIKRSHFSDSVWCIDEPEAHIGTRAQARLLREMYRLLPVGSQLILASHSIGLMKEAVRIGAERPGEVVFLDMDGHDFDAVTVIRPTVPDRAFWQRSLDVALDDLAALVSPREVVMCEGRPGASKGKNADFDAKCYRTIFHPQFPDTDFLSVGNSDDASNDTLGLGVALQTLTPGTKIIRLIDRDLRTDEEIDLAGKQGVQVLSRRHIESFLYDDEVLTALCHQYGRSDLVSEILSLKQDAIKAATTRGKDADDIKAAAGDIYNGVRTKLNIRQPGSNQYAFATAMLAPLIRPGMSVYDELRKCIFAS